MTTRGPLYLAALAFAGLTSFGATAEGSVYCTVTFEYLAYRDSSFWLYERHENDCDWAGLVKVGVFDDSVVVRRPGNLRSLSDSLLKEVLNRSRDSWTADRGFSTTLSLPRYGWRIDAPGFLLDQGLDLRQRRIPTIVGADVRSLYWEGCGKYTNYYLKDAVVDPSGKHLLLITHSDWEEQRVGYDLQCSPGDGFVVFEVLSDGLTLQPDDGPVLVEILLDSTGHAIDAKIERGTLDPETEARVLADAASWGWHLPVGTKIRRIVVPYSMLPPPLEKNR